MRVYEKNKHWYLEGMIRKKRYHEAIPEAKTEKESILNHKNIKTTMRYVHNTFEQKLNAVNSLNNL